MLVHIAMESTDGIRLTAVLLTETDPPGALLMQASSSTDAAATWSPVVDVCKTGIDADFRRLFGSADGTRLTIVWAAGNDNANLLAATSRDGGASWSPPVKWSLSIAGPADALSFATSRDGTRLLAFWHEFLESSDVGRIWHGLTTSPFIVRASTSRDGGATWSTAANLSPGNNHAGPLAIAMSDDGTRLTVVWYLATWSRRNVAPTVFPWGNRFFGSPPSGGKQRLHSTKETRAISRLFRSPRSRYLRSCWSRERGDPLR